MATGTAAPSTRKVAGCLTRAGFARSNRSGPHVAYGAASTGFSAYTSYRLGAPDEPFVLVEYVDDSMLCCDEHWREFRKTAAKMAHAYAGVLEAEGFRVDVRLGGLDRANVKVTGGGAS